MIIKDGEHIYNFDHVVFLTIGFGIATQTHCLMGRLITGNRFEVGNYTSKTNAKYALEHVCFAVRNHDLIWNVPTDDEVTEAIKANTWD